MKYPNLFLVGAPKCGTTSIFNALARHREVYASPEKEPHFFSKDIYRKKRISCSEYAQLFEAVNPSVHKWAMEGSTRYLYSQTAIPEILTKNPDARFVVLVRDPVEMLHSLHNHLYFLGVEKEKDFEKAWEKTLKIDRDLMIEQGCTDPDSLDYKTIAKFGMQVKRMKKHVPYGNYIIFTYEELEFSPHEVIDRLCDFLQLYERNDLFIAQENSSMARKSQTLFNLVQKAGWLKKKLGLKRSFGYLRSINRMNEKKNPRKELSSNFVTKVRRYFDADIDILERETGRELSGWRAKEQW